MQNRANEPFDVPFPLPEHWRAMRRWAEDGKVIIIEWPGHGFVTVDKRQRNFELGDSMVHKSKKTVYSGFGWEKRLFEDAIAALKAAWVR